MFNILTYVHYTRYQFYFIVFLLDINECDNDADNHCEHNCENRVGTYTCNCNDGYLLSDGGYTCYGKHSLK